MQMICISSEYFICQCSSFSPSLPGTYSESLLCVPNLQKQCYFPICKIE
uniref:Uncharacterized protein n=1 Tax=Rhizophora mucronata TaxID=61149 RepID=A0A2P2QU89_RHIMU